MRFRQSRCFSRGSLHGGPHGTCVCRFGIVSRAARGYIRLMPRSPERVITYRVSDGAAAVRAIPDGFALFEGGPILEALRRLTPARPVVDTPAARALVTVGVTWLPLCALSAYEGLAFQGTALPFVYDIQSQVRLLITLPLLVLAAHQAHMVAASSMERFVECGILRERDHERFTAILRAASRWNHSPFVRLVVLAVVLFLGRTVWKQALPSLGGTAWYGDPSVTAGTLTMAGHWLVWVTNPIFQYVQVVWFLRIILYAVTLARIAALDLRLVATHPDHAGGLGFLGAKLYAFGQFVVAEGSGVAGILANRIFHEALPLPLFKMDIAITAVVVAAIVLAPFCVFMPKLLETKRKGYEQYGRFANRYVGQFEERWLEDEAPHRQLLGAPDIQSLADLGNSYQLVDQMRLVPFSNRALIGIFVAFLLPIAPLLLTVIPAEELLSRLIGAFIG